MFTWYTPHCPIHPIHLQRACHRHSCRRLWRRRQWVLRSIPPLSLWWYSPSKQACPPFVPPCLPFVLPFSRHERGVNTNAQHIVRDLGGLLFSDECGSSPSPTSDADPITATKGPEGRDNLLEG